MEVYVPGDYTIEGSPFILQHQYIARVQFSSLIYDNYNMIDLSAFDCINSSLSGIDDVVTANIAKNVFVYIIATRQPSVLPSAGNQFFIPK